ncbi:non-ribosomal peptide synthetase [Chitinophaga sp. HK235]|uniref:non-ribosomal peptide synthetase n=1 Tax=Chitinophaga sp. HK235 TaxID=2952571 RepID=UPI001BAB4C9C|nr:non-ribosomal peptide synthetase [Chitinophaga sp. HK235]
MHQLLEELIGKGIYIVRENDNLKVKYNGTKLPEDILFTIRENKERLLEYLRKLERVKSQDVIDKVTPQDTYPLSSAQKRLWMLYQIDGEGTAYNMPSKVFLNGEYDIDCFKKAVYAAIDRHEILRTVFVTDDEDGVRQRVMDREVLGFEIGYADFRGTEEKAAAYIDADAYRPFDLEQGPLLRASLLQVADDRYIFYYNLHHIISDGWSMGILERDVIRYYEAFISGTTVRLPKLPIQYKDYAAWQLSRLETEQYRGHQVYWLDKFSGELPVLDLPAYKSRPRVKTDNGQKLSTPMPADVTAALYQYCRERGGSAFMGLLAAWNVLCYRYTSQTDIITGTPVAGREHSDLEDQIGFYVNTLALRNQVNPQESFDAFFERVKENTLSSYEHQQYPFDRLVEELGATHDTGRSAIFDVMLVLQNTEDNRSDVEMATDWQDQIKDHGYDTAKFDIDLTFYEIGHRIYLAVTYNTDVYDREMIEQLMVHYRSLLAALLENPGQSLGAVEYLAAAEKDMLLNTFNATTADFPADKTVVDLLAEQVSANPDSTAVIFEGRELTYLELDLRSNQLAHYLKERGIREGELVPVYLERSMELIIAVWALLKAGAAYLPIDTNNPKDRVKFMLDDSGARFVLSMPTLLSAFELENITPVYVEEANYHDRPGYPVAVKPDPGKLVYVIYTSGSTGLPKGVMIGHQALLARMCFYNRFYGLRGGDSVLFYSSFSFDAAIEEYILPFVSGARCVIAGTDFNNELFANIVEYVERFSITRIFTSPVLLQHIVDELTEDEVGRLASLRHIICGGEKISVETVNGFYRKLGVLNHCTLYNAYGPTENTNDSTILKLEHKIYRRISIGKPIENTTAYILDECNNLTPPGVAGELLLGGAGLAFGYLNRPELTAERFIPHPFLSGERLYRTGDVGRWLPDGNIEFLGRNDNQVKIRGYRIELGEIENTLLDQETISQAVVIARQYEGSTRLVAYVIPKGAYKKSDIREQLKRRLPEYMVPGIFVELTAFPLTVNGKVDTKRLPEPGAEDVCSETYEPAQTPYQQQIIDIWKDLLRQERIGINDNFFSLGGDSIMAIQTVSRAKKAGIALKVKDLYTFQTIKELSKSINGAVKAISEQGILEGEAPLLPIQQHFFEQGYDNPDHFNQSVLLTVPKHITIPVLQDAVVLLFQQHDALRLRYFLKDEKYHGIYDAAIPALEIETAGTAAEITSICEAYQKKISIKTGNLAKFVFIETPSGDAANRLFICIHHLGIDGVSWRILTDDLSAYIHTLKAGQIVSPGAKTTSCRQWQARLKEYADNYLLKNEAEYWSGILSRAEEVPQDYVFEGKSAQSSFRIQHVTLSEEETGSLLQECNDAFGTEINDLVLGALAMSLAEVFRKNQFVIGLEGHGREHLYDDVDISNTVGWFTTLYPVLLEAFPGDVETTLVQTKENLRSIPHKGIGYGVLRYLSDHEPVRKRLSKDIEQVVFNYFGQIGLETASSEQILGIAREHKGTEIGEENQHNGKISINGLVVNNCLKISISYDTNRYAEETITALAELYRQSLQQIISLCKAAAVVTKTPADYGVNGIVSYRDLKQFIKEQHVSDLYRLSPLQEGMLFHSLFDNDPHAYISQTSLDWHGEFNESAFIQAWEYVAAKHSILRTSFHIAPFDAPVQCVHEKITLPVTILDYTDMDDRTKEEKLSEFLKIDARTPFELHKAPLFRLTVIKTGPSVVKVVYAIHHMIADGWSSPVIFSECFRAYEQAVQNGHLPAPEKIDHYKAYLDFIERRDISKTRHYWQEQLKQLDTASLLPFCNDKERNKTFGNTARSFTKQETYVAKLEAFARKNNLTVNTIVQGAWSYLLSRYVNHQTVVFGTVISGRSTEIEEVENRVGLYINTIPLCTTLHEEEAVTTWLNRLQIAQTTSREEYGHASLADIQKQSPVKGILFDSLLVFENYPVDAIKAVKSKLDIDNVRVKQQNNYLLTISANHYPEKALSITFEYNSTLLSESIIDMMEGHFKVMLDAILEETKIGALDLLTAAEKEELVLTHNQSAQAVDDTANVVALFKRQAVATPEKPALRYKNRVVSYAELDRLSDQVAKHLTNKCAVKKGAVVGFKLDRDEWEVITVLGILKAGAAYLPIAPDVTAAREAFILQDAGIAVLITNTNYLFDLTDYQGIIFSIDVELEASEGAVETRIDQNDLAYILYTSGSTGVPKGVMITHGSLVNYLLWAKTMYLGNELSSGDFGLFTTLSFDLTVTSLMLPLISGNTLEIFEKGQVSAILKQYFESNISCIKLTPAHISLLQELELSQTGVELAIVGGDALQQHHVDILRSLNPDMKIYNEYGPTEATVGCMIYEVPFTAEAISIGRPAFNTQIYLLNDRNQLQPKYTIGEICIGGAGLAKGYVNQPTLTAEKFIHAPFGTGDRIYKTGDLAIRNADGSLLYLGRKDNQVKIRGYRIELGEIEACLCTHKEVSEAVVIPVDAGHGKELVACLVSGSSLTINDLRSYLSKQLPEYMVPSRFVKLDKIPLTANGKVDREALLTAGQSEITSGIEYLAASTAAEEKLVAIWQEHLEVDRVGIKDDYFQLGGDSIKMIRLISKINKTFKIDLPIGIFYEKPTIAALSDFISQHESAGKPDYELINRIEADLAQLESTVLQAYPDPENIAAVYPMSDIQVGMAITSQVAVHRGDFGVYHDQFLFPLGVIDLPRLEKAMARMADKHETFRTTYHLYEYGSPVQIIHRKVPVGIGYRDLSSLSGAEQEAYIHDFLADERINNSFDVTKAPLWRITILQIGAADTLFVFQFHHAIMDGWGQNNFKVELFRIYKALETAEDYRPEPLKCGMRDSILSDLMELESESSKTFWQNNMQDYKRLDILSEEPADKQASRAYPKDFSTRLLEKCKQDKVTPKALFLSGSLYVLGMLSYETDMTVGVVTHKRPITEDGDKLLGCFLNSVPFRFDVAFSKGLSWKGFVHQVERSLNELKGKDRMPLNTIAELAGEEAKENPFFDVIFNYVNFHVISELYDDEDFQEQQSKREVKALSYESYERTNTFLDIAVNQTLDNISLTFVQQRALKSNRTLEDLIQFYDNFLHNYLESDSEVMSHTAIIPEAEKEQLFAFGHHYSSPDNQGATLVSLFERQVHATPDNIALVYNDHQYTYSTLNELANKFAYYLYERFDVVEGDLVALQLEKSEWAMIAILGVQKAGAAYVPIDPAYPEERITYLKMDSACKLCVDEGMMSGFIETRNSVAGSRKTIITPDSLAYVIYTSGSTGNPKGVEVTHAGVVNTILAPIAGFEINAQSKVLQFTSLSFDVSVYEIFATWISGGSLHVADEATRRTPDKLQDYIVREQIDIVSLAPAYLKTLDISRLHTLKMLMTAGEPADVEKVTEYLNQSAGAYINAYGPTETSIFATLLKIDKAAELMDRAMPIGKPLANVKIYILDDNQNIAPLGVMGEIYIGGAGLANGYLHRPELTAEKFISSPLHASERLYRTGDFGRWLPDGNIAFFGRKDEQVKIRGYRIELGEIESRLLLKPGIREAVVVVANNEADEKELRAYFVADMMADERSLRDELSTGLPAYMLPDKYIQLKAIPLTPNGKTDRGQLLKMESIGPGAGGNYVAPKDELERKLVRMWEDVIKGRRIGVSDSFFDMGGNSLKAMQLVTRMRQELNVDIDILMLYQYPTVEKIKIPLENLMWASDRFDKEDDNTEIFSF